MNNYEVQKVVGEGSYGRAVLCKRKKDRKACIIKQISLAKLSRKEAKLTEQEALLLGKLQHPNIVTFWESFVGNNQLHIVMEFADGGDLDHHIKNYCRVNRVREIPEAHVLNLFVQISLAIKYIHDRKILHRDLKSQNVFLTSAGICKLGDFGVSKVLRNTVELAATQIGTPYYMSPEIMNNQRYNSKTDIWSLGVILYELACLRMPFQGNSMKQLVYSILNSSPTPPSSSYSKEMRDLIRDILIKDPKKRPGINNVLGRGIIKDRIRHFLDENRLQREFSHTILHGQDVMRAMSTMAAAPVQPPQLVPSAQPISAVPPPASKLMAAPVSKPPPPPQFAPKPTAPMAPSAPAVPAPASVSPWLAAPKPVASKITAADLGRRESVEAIMKRILGPAQPKPHHPAPVVAAAAKPSSACPRPEVVVAARIPSAAPSVVPSVAVPRRLYADPVVRKPAVPSAVAPSRKPPSPVPAPAPLVQRIAPAGRKSDVSSAPEPAAPIPSHYRRVSDPPVRAPVRRPSNPDADMMVRGAAVAPGSTPSSARSEASNPFGDVIGSNKAGQQQLGGEEDSNAAGEKRRERVEVKLAEKKAQPWLDNLQNQMGQLKQQVQHIQASKSPLPPPEPSTPAFLSGLEKQMGELKQQVQGMQAARTPAPSLAPRQAAPANTPCAERGSVEWLTNLQQQMGNLKVQVQQMQSPAMPIPHSPLDPSSVAPPQLPSDMIGGGAPGGERKIGGDAWLSNLQKQMGDLKSQVDLIKAAKSPALTPPPSSFPVGERDRQSFPLHARKPPANLTPIPMSVASNNNRNVPRAGPSVLTPPSAQGRVPVPSRAAAGPPSKAGAGAPKPTASNSSHSDLSKPPAKPLQPPSRRTSDPNHPKPDNRAKAPSPVPVESLEQRKASRQKHRVGFKEFLQAQKEAKRREEEEDHCDGGALPSEAVDHREAQRAALRNLIQAKRKELQQQQQPQSQPERQQAEDNGPAIEDNIIIATPKDQYSRERMLRQMERQSAASQAWSKQADLKGRQLQAAAIRQGIVEDEGKIEDDDRQGVGYPVMAGRSIIAELDDEIQFQRPTTPDKQGGSSPHSLDDLLYAHISPADKQRDFLGQSFVLEYHAQSNDTSAQLLDAQSALDYSLMFQQMQSILEAPFLALSPDKFQTALQTIDEADREDEEVEEGFEEQSISFFLSDDEDGQDDLGHVDLLHDFMEEDDNPAMPVFESVEMPHRAPRGQAASHAEFDLLDLRAMPSVSESYESVAFSFPVRESVDQDAEHDGAADRIDKLWQTVVKVNEEVCKPRSVVELPSPSELLAGYGDIAEWEPKEPETPAVDEEFVLVDRAHTGENAAVGEDGAAMHRTHAWHEESDALVEVDARTVETRSMVLTKRLIAELGVDMFQAAMEILSSSLLEDGDMDEDDLLILLERVLGEQNLGCLEDMYELLSA